ncbi:hypothetical protein LguiB_035627 [Lonicera macranthoides]
MLHDLSVHHSPSNSAPNYIQAMTIPHPTHPAVALHHHSPSPGVVTHRQLTGPHSHPPPHPPPATSHK